MFNSGNGREMTDCFLYSGDIDSDACHGFMRLVEEEKQNTDVALILSTHGGDPDAAYKVGRHLQFRYENVKIFVPGACKSAGTLLAIAANELVFSPYGELGPLDVQMRRKDSIFDRESGLVIHEAFNFLKERTKEIYLDLVVETHERSRGAISYRMASHFASKIASSLFDPIFARIDPEEIGKNARAMRIAEDYGIRLNWKSKNLQNTSYALEFLTWRCPSHDFAIDQGEAELLFKHVRSTNEPEEQLIHEFQEPEEDKPMIGNLTDKFQEIEAAESKQRKQGENKPHKRTNGESKETPANATDEEKAPRGEA